MKAGLDVKRGLSRMSHARAYRKYAHETLGIVKVLIPCCEVGRGLIDADRRLLTEPGMSMPTMSHTMTKKSVSPVQPRPSTGPFSATGMHSQPLNWSRAGRHLCGPWHAPRLESPSHHLTILRRG